MPGPITVHRIKIVEKKFAGDIYSERNDSNVFLPRLRNLVIWELEVPDSIPSFYIPFHNFKPKMTGYESVKLWAKQILIHIYSQKEHTEIHKILKCGGG